MMTRLLKPHQATFQLTLIECKEPFSLLCCQPGVSQNTFDVPASAVVQPLPA
jgi:hypothetical protein